MIIYIALVFGLLLIGLGIKPRRSYQRKKIFLILSFVLLTVISGFRDYSVGVDTKAYIIMFNNIDVMNFLTSRYEQGFLYFLKIIRLLSDNPTVFLLLSSVICIGTTCIFIYKYSEDPVLSILLYVLLKPYFFQMTGIRQAIATAFVMLAFSIILERKTVRNIIISILLLLLAISFHNMSFVALIPFGIWLTVQLRASNIINPKVVLKWTILVSAIVFISYSFIMRMVSFIIPQYAHYFAGIWGEKNYSASLFKMLIQFVFLVTGYVFLRKKETTELDQLALIMICISVIVGTLSMRMEIWGRLTGMFSIYTSILFAPLFTSRIYDIKNRIIVKSSVFLFSFAYMIVTFIFRPEWDGVVPYLFK